MALITVKPTSPGRRAHGPRGHAGPAQGRAVRAADRERRARPVVATTTAASPRVTTAAAHKQHYRMIDFKRDKEGIAGRVERIEYDPNRTAHIALLLLRRRRAPLHHRAEGR